jgi:hypothetical protein
MQLAGALQGEVKAVVEFPCLLAVQLRQAACTPARIQSSPVPASKASSARRTQFQAALDAADIADAHHQERLVEAVVVVVLVDAPALRAA